MSAFLPSRGQPGADVLTLSEGCEPVLPRADPERPDHSMGRLDAALQHLRTTAAPSADRPMPPGQSAPCAPALQVRVGNQQPLRLSPERKRTVLALALGKAHLNAGSLHAAEREFRDALISDPGNGDAHNNLAVTLTLLGRLDEAERELKAAEKAGIKVSLRIREEIRKRRAVASP